MRRFVDRFIRFCLIVLLLWGVGRLYFNVTGGFRVGKITSDLAYDAQCQTRPLSDQEQELLYTIFSQPFSYLGKGCQSYVFLSQDGEYVIKFLKYQHFRPPAWLDVLSVIPAVDRYREHKIEKKKRFLAAIFKSWKIAYEDLQDNTGVVYIHINKTNNLNKQLFIQDKIGITHTLDLDNMEFMVQKRVRMLGPTIETLMQQGKSLEAKALISRLTDMMLEEHIRGYTDKDHALMQNTGVHAGKPLHIDVGQIVRDDNICKPEVYHQEIYNKTYRFRIWLEKHYPELLAHLNHELHGIMGDKFFSMKYYPKLKK